MKNLITRALSGIVYVALIVAALIGGHSSTMLLMAIFSVIAIAEFQNLTDNTRHSAVRIAARVVDILFVLVISWLEYKGEVTAVSLIAYPVIRIVLALYDKSEDALRAVLRSLFSVVYIAVPLLIVGRLMLDSYSEGSYALVLAMFVMIWLNDTGAYCVGSTMGKHRLCERLSPKKSWEGFFGGLLFCVGAGVACSYLTTLSMTVVEWIGMGVVVCVFSTWGDLFESLIKRTLHVKDSGHLIPGHGGILDRIDSLLLVAPALLLYLSIIG